MKRKTAKILGASMMGAGVLTLPFNLVAGAALIGAGGYTAGILGAKPPKDQPGPDSASPKP